MAMQYGVRYYHTMKISKIEKVMISYLAGWEGRLSASRLGRVLGVRREHASRKLMPWARTFLDLGEIEGSRQTVRAREDASDLMEGLRTPRELMDALPGLALVSEADEIDRPSIVRLNGVLCAEGDPEIFQKIFMAMCRREAIYLSYLAKSGPQSFVFSPHTLVDNFHRPHFRGYAVWPSGTSLFIDMVPSRVIEVDGVEANAYVDGRHDKEWHEMVDVELSLSSDLPDGLRSTILQEWGHQVRLVDGSYRLTLKGIRRPLAGYVRDLISWRTSQGIGYRVWTD